MGLRAWKTSYNPIWEYGSKRGEIVGGQGASPCQRFRVTPYNLVGNFLLEDSSCLGRKRQMK